MATTAIAGYGGSIAGPSGVNEVLNWSADINVEALDATSMASDGWKEFIEGLKGATFSATVQGTVMPAIGLTAVTLKASSSAVTISGSAIITSVKPEVPVDGKVTFGIDATFTGSVSIA